VRTVRDFLAQDDLAVLRDQVERVVVIDKDGEVRIPRLRPIARTRAETDSRAHLTKSVLSAINRAEDAEDTFVETDRDVFDGAPSQAGSVGGF
jgi:hypothetical protein